MFTSILIISTGLIIGIIGSLAGGTTSMLTLSFLSFLSVPAHQSISIYRFGATSFMIGGFIKYWKEKRIIWRYSLILSLIAIPTTLLGSQIALSIDGDLFSLLIKILLIIFIPFIFLDKKIGVIREKVKRRKIIGGYIFDSILSIISGIIPFGFGMIATYNYLFLFQFTMIELKAISRLPRLVANLTGFYVFFQAGVFDIKLSVLLAIGLFFGGYIGAKVTIKIGDKKLKIILALTILILIFISFIK